MKLKELQTLFEQEKVRELAWQGGCHDCREETEVVARVEDDGLLMISGGAVYSKESEYFIKCSACFDNDSELKNWRLIEVYSRVVGYLRPIQQWNPGKRQEFEERVLFKVGEAEIQKTG